MIRTSQRLIVLAAGLALAGLASPQVTQVNLVSDGFVPAQITDPNLVNAWGLDFSPTGPLWVSDNGTGLSTVYQNDGTIAPLVVTVPPTDSSPTGIVFNGGSNFMVSTGGTSAPARFIFVTEGGQISGWAPTIDSTHAIQVVNRHWAGANYKGVTIGANDKGEFLFATNFRSGMIDVFDSNFKYVTSFTDRNMTRAYAPFNIKAYGDFLIVTWAKSDPTGHDDVHGAGNGFVELWTTSGRFISRLVSHGALNSPWGIALAIDGQGNPTTRLYIGNFGDGRINKYDLLTGEFLGPVRDADAKPVVIEGLWALAFRNLPDPTTGKMVRTLFFTAGPDDEAHGLLGKLVPVVRSD